MNGKDIIKMFNSNNNGVEDNWMWSITRAVDDLTFEELKYAVRNRKASGADKINL